MKLEILNRAIKPGDIVAGPGAYKSECLLFVVVGFTAKNVRVIRLDKNPAYNKYLRLKSQVALIPDAENYLESAIKDNYDQICKDHNII